MIKIRRAQRKDVDAIHAFINDLENEVFDRKQFSRIYNANLKNKHTIYLVAVDKKPVGYISCHTQQLLHHCGPIAEIQELYVAASVRSQGIGKLLVDEVKRIARKKRILQIEVTSRLTRTRAHAFYEKENFSWTHKKLIFNVASPEK